MQKLLFLENNLFFYFYPFSFWKKKSKKKHLSIFLPRPDQTNVDSHIFVLMYVDDKIVKWTVINNVNMVFFLNKDFNEIASNERTAVVFIAM